MACWRPKRFKTHVESKLMLKMRFAAEKSRFEADLGGEAAMRGARCREGVPQLGEG